MRSAVASQMRVRAAYNLQEPSRVTTQAGVVTQQAQAGVAICIVKPTTNKPAFRFTCRAARLLSTFPIVKPVVKPARLHFARTARALRDAMCVSYVCERGDLSEFLAARTCASCWLDNQTSKTRMCARLEIRTGRLAHM